jgi:hypothetical protein
VDCVLDSWDLTAWIWVYKWQVFDLLNNSYRWKSYYNH